MKAPERSLLVSGAHTVILNGVSIVFNESTFRMTTSIFPIGWDVYIISPEMLTSIIQIDFAPEFHTERN